MSKPTVYLDTNIISALFYDGGESAAVAHRLAGFQGGSRDRFQGQSRIYGVLLRSHKCGSVSSTNFGKLPQADYQPQRLVDVRLGWECLCHLAIKPDQIGSPAAAGHVLPLDAAL